MSKLEQCYHPTPKESNWFMSPEDAQEKIETWRQDYNHFRPHSSLADVPPVLFAKQFYESQPSRIIYV
jgi:transposase InsO family protein